VQRLLYVCLGGAVGSGARYLLTLFASTRFGVAFPFGTLAVNLIGCFLMGLIMPIAVKETFSQDLRFTLTAGFLGGLTTYSSFNYETTMLMRDGAPQSAAINFAATVIGCFLAGFCGLLIGQRVAA
jgi:CrcB protein